MAGYAQIVFGFPLKECFDYAIPSVLEKELKIGKRVYVPFRKKKIVGYCIGKSRESKSAYTKEIISVLDKEPLFSKKFLHFLKWLGEKYFASWGEMLLLATPAYLRKPLKTPAREEEAFAKVDLEINLSSPAQEIIKSREEGKNNFFIFDDYFQKKRLGLYQELCLWMLGEGKDVLVIVPEIYLAEELLKSLREKIPARKILLYHSGLKEKEIFLTWWAMKKKEPKIVVGTRSVVFHPGENLGLIILEDEISPFHKHEEFPYYDARGVALSRAHFFKIPLIFAGSPPSVETYYRIEKGLFSLLDLREKPKSLPHISLVDLGMFSGRNHISKPLELKIAELLKMKKQMVIFLKRRGFASFIRCRKCGKVLKCKRCERNLIYHFSSRKLVCHYCETKQEPPLLCPDCQGGYLRYQGLGTEKLESELSRFFPQAKISRIDLDIKREKRIEERLKDFQAGKIDILIGTDLLMKLPPLNNVGLLGIINLEQGTNFPDFRAQERLFSLLLHLLKMVKREELWGDCLIQTYNPQSNLLTALKNLDYEQFYREELNSRRELGLPPFKKLVVINLRGKSKKSVEKNSHLLARRLKEENNYRGIFISEALPHPLFKLRDKYNWQIFIKSGKIIPVFNLLNKVLKGKRKFKGSVLTVEVEGY